MMSLIFLLVMGIMAAGVGSLMGSQNRLSAGYQQSRQQFQQINGALNEASRDKKSLLEVIVSDDATEAGSARRNGLDLDTGTLCHDTPGNLSSAICLERALLRAGYGCRVSGFSSGSCFAMEIRSWRVASSAPGSEKEPDGNRQISGLLIETPNIVSGGDGRAGVFP